jgi:hypothetical protein
MSGSTIFWLGFIIGGIVCVAAFEFIQTVILSAMGIKKLQKELERKNDIEERKYNLNERKEPKL